MNQAISQAPISNTAPWLEAAAFGLMLCDAELTVLHANGRCGEMLNLAQEHMSGRHLFDLLELPDPQRELALQELEQNQTWQGLARIGQPGRHANSGQRALKVDVRGTGAGAVVSLIDYSADLEHLQKLTDAKTMAEKSNEAKSQFLQHMSHELRTPLNAIIGFTQLLKISSGLDAVERDNVAEIEKAGASLLVLINEILDLSKIEAGKLRLSEGHVDLGTLVKECLQLAAPMAAPRGIQIDTRIAGDTLLLADHVRLKQILMNLLSNAIKYNRDEGTVVLQSINVADNKLRLEIRDSGVGIAPEHLQTIFSPFDRIGSIEGSGIGLMITRRLVALMEGTIGVFSLPGRGSVFWVELPRKRLSILESMLLLSGTETTATAANLKGPVCWIGERTPLFIALEGLREARPSLVLRRYATVSTLGALANEQPGVVLLSQEAALEIAQMNDLPKALKGARLYVVMDSRERRTPLASTPLTSLRGQSVLPVSEDSKLPALLDLLDSPGQKSHELMSSHEPIKSQEPGLNKP